MIVVVDVANVLGSRPEGWWRDRAGAAGRLFDRLDPLAGSPVTGPDGAPLRINRLIAVLEGAARSAVDPATGVEVIRAERDGDSAVVMLVNELPADVLVVTADRGLRQRLPPEVATAGPNWLNELIGR